MALAKPKVSKNRKVSSDTTFTLGEGVACASQVGTLVHSALERGIRDANTLARFAEGSVSREWVEEAIMLAQRFDQDAAFALFHEALASREQAVTLTVEQLRLNGVVDLVGNDRVLNFKTDQEVTPQHHRFQLWAYAWALARQKAHIAYLRHNQLHTFDATELEIASQEVQTLVQGIFFFLTLPCSAVSGKLSGVFLW